MIRVLVADDSPTARALLVALLSSEPGIQVVGEARDGREAVDMTARLGPDVVTMDVHMPKLDGLEATKEIMTRSPRPIIIVSTTTKIGDVELSLEAIRAGAVLALPKPRGPEVLSHDPEQRHLVNMVKAMAQVKLVRRHGTPTSSPVVATPLPRARVARPIRLVAIAASTGGPAALLTILAALPKQFPVPILVVQHIARGFTQGLAHWLGGGTPLRVAVAALGEVARAGTVYIAPDDHHLGIQVGADGVMRLLIDSRPAVGSFRPSATHLFRSAATAMGSSTLGVILTGMGDDGVDGLRDLFAAGGHVLAQDEATSVIFGMPAEAVRAGVVHGVLPISQIADQLVELTS